MNQPAPHSPAGSSQGPGPGSLALLLGRCGITRLANVTDQDVIGIPVGRAVRPMAKTVRVTHGAGGSAGEALLEAAWEAASLWHAESAVPAAAAAGTAGEVRPGYRLADLGLPASVLDTDRTPMEWVRAMTVPGGHDALVPRDLVRLGPREHWRPGQLAGTADGLAAGTGTGAAIARALFAIMERDALERCHAAPRPLDLDTVTDDACTALIARARDVGARLAAAAVPSRFGAACFTATLQADGTGPLAPGGAAAHRDPAVALARALAGAARSRLVLLTGTGEGACPPPGTPAPDATAPPASWAEVTAGAGWPAGAAGDDGAGEAAARIAAVTGAEPAVVGLGEIPGLLAVVKVVCPGLAAGARQGREGAR